jgi:hypothetical protein
MAHKRRNKMRTPSEPSYENCRESCKRICEEQSWCSWESVGNEVSAEVEESPLLEAVIRKRLVKTEQTEKS